VHRKNIPIYIQQDATLHSLFYLETAPHVSEGITTQHQERKQLYLQHLLFVTPLLLPAAIVTGSSNGVTKRYRRVNEVWRVGAGPPARPHHDQQRCYHQAPTVNQRLLLQLLWLLMMGMRMPETCWAVFKWQVINLRVCCIWLVDSVESMMMHGLVKPKIRTVDENLKLELLMETAHNFTFLKNTTSCWFRKVSCKVWGSESRRPCIRKAIWTLERYATQNWNVRLPWTLRQQIRLKHL
jgi:hypothetical protein